MDSPAEGKSLKRKHVTLTLAQKLDVIREAESSELSHEQIAKKYGIGSSSVGRFLKHKEAIKSKIETYREYGVEERRTLKVQSFPLLEQALFVWILQQRNANVIVSAEVLKAKAQQLLVNFQQRGCYEGCHFLASNGWARRFRHRFGLRTVVTAGEKASADLEAYTSFKPVLMKKILDMGLNPSQLFNADESAIFIKLIASRTVVLWDEKAAAGRKLNRIRYTFMPCSNMDGTLKLKLMFIGTSENPRDLPRNKEALPVSYYNAKKAWMTRILFKKWFDDEFVPAVRKFSEENGLEPKALLVLDNCSAHHIGCDLRSDDGLIEVIYLPPNVTSECQPMDQAVINAIKTRYKKKLMLKLILEDEHLSFNQRLKNVSLSQCMDWLASSWDEISAATIRNSWNKLIDEFPGFEYDEPWPDENITGDIKMIIEAADEIAGTETSQSDVDRWLNDQVVDSEGNMLSVTNYQYSDEEIISSVLQRLDDTTCTDEEWLDSSDENYQGTDEQQTVNGASPNRRQNFSNVLKSLDNVIDYVRGDLQEVTKLTALRNKLVGDKWKERNLNVV